MPSAGQIIRAADFTTPAYANEITDELGFTNTSYTAGSVVCGVTFVAPTSGRVKIDFWGRGEPNTANTVFLSAAVRTGGTIGSGSSVLIANDNSAVIYGASSSQDFAGSGVRYVSGLTAGSTYNAVTEHRVDGGNGDMFDRSILVYPLP